MSTKANPIGTMPISDVFGFCVMSHAITAIGNDPIALTHASLVSRPGVRNLTILPQIRRPSLFRALKDLYAFIGARFAAEGIVGRSGGLHARAPKRVAIHVVPSVVTCARDDGCDFGHPKGEMKCHTPPHLC